MDMWFDRRSNRIIRVSWCRSDLGGYTFYKTQHLAKQGTRVRLRPAQWFLNLSEAQQALDIYCSGKKQYIRLPLHEILRRFEALKPKQFNPIFRKWI